MHHLVNGKECVNREEEDEKKWVTNFSSTQEEEEKEGSLFSFGEEEDEQKLHHKNRYPINQEKIFHQMWTKKQFDLLNKLAYT